MPSSRARLPPDLGVPGAFFEILRQYIPAYSFARPTDWGKKIGRKAGLVYINTPSMNPALSRGIVRFPLKFLRDECGNRETIYGNIYIYIYTIGEKW